MPNPRRGMLAKGMYLAIIVFAGSVACAQPPADTSLERTLNFTHAGTPQACQEIGNAIRTMTGVQQAAIDDALKSVTVRGTAGQVAFAEWLFRELDKPAGGQPRDSGTHEFRAPGDSDSVARVFYLAYVKTPQNLQELVNTIRTVADIQYMFPNIAQQAIALRATPAQVAMVEWLVNALDISQDGRPAATQRRQAATYPYPAPPRVLPSGAPDPSWRVGDTIVRVSYMADTDTPQGIQEIVNAIRTVAEIQRMFPYFGVKAIVLRGTAAQDALGEWLLNELDAPADAQPPAPGSQNPVTREYQMSGDSSDIVQVLHFQNKTAQELQDIANSIRTKLSIQRLFAASAKSALALRGTASQVALAGQLIRERNAPGAR